MFISKIMPKIKALCSRTFTLFFHFRWLCTYLNRWLALTSSDCQQAHCTLTRLLWQGKRVVLMYFRCISLTASTWVIPLTRCVESIGNKIRNRWFYMNNSQSDVCFRGVTTPWIILVRFMLHESSWIRSLTMILSNDRHHLPVPSTGHRNCEEELRCSIRLDVARRRSMASTHPRRYGGTGVKDHSD